MINSSNIREISYLEIRNIIKTSAPDLAKILDELSPVERCGI